MLARTPQRHGLPEGWGIPIGTGIGAAIGLIVGQVLGQLALGLVFGAAIGLVAGTVATASTDVPAGQRRTVLLAATAVLAVGVVATVIILVS
jgi:hypothetical protein